MSNVKFKVTTYKCEGRCVKKKACGSVSLSWDFLKMELTDLKQSKYIALQYRGTATKMTNTSIYFNFKMAVHLETTFIPKMTCIIHKLLCTVVHYEDDQKRERKKSKKKIWKV